MDPASGIIDSGVGVQPSFLELFAGMARLTGAIMRWCGHKVVRTAPVQSWHGWDICDDSCFEMAAKLSSGTTRVRGAPPCGTNSPILAQDVASS